MFDVRLFPLFDRGKHFVRRSWLLPAIFTALISLILIGVDRPIVYFYSLATYISAAMYFFIYLMCHERKPLWVAVLIAATTFLMISTNWLRFLLLAPFRSMAFFGDQANIQGMSFPAKFLHFFVAAGLAEEFVKVIPVLACCFIATKFHNRFSRAVGVRTPLDGILLGAASGIGFAFVETMYQYVPQAMEQAGASGGKGLAMYAGLTLMIPRLLGTLFGHMAYAGYFGYFVGLAALRVLPTWRVLLVGWLSAATLHGLWDTFADTQLGVFSEAWVACLSYCCLAAAILEARRMSRPIIGFANVRSGSEPAPTAVSVSAASGPA